MQQRADAAHSVLNYYGVLYSQIAIILPHSLCLKGKSRGESGCWEKHRPEKIYFNLPNASAGLLTFSNWYFPRNSIVSLHNSIIEPLIDSDYTQHDCSCREMCVCTPPQQYMWQSERIRQKTDAVHHLQDEGTNSIANFLLHLTKQMSGLCRHSPEVVIC